MKYLALLMFIVMVIVSGCNKQHRHDEENVWYTCSMDPQVMEKKPGLCPICKMDLTKIIIDPKKQDNSIRLSTSQMELANIKVDTVRSASVADGILWRGVVSENKNKTEVLSARVPGRVDKVLIKETGRKVRKGEILYHIYSEELNSAIEEYLLAKEKAKTIKSSAVDYNKLARVAAGKLKTWGLEETQFSDLSKNRTLIPFFSPVSGVIAEVNVTEGEYVQTGTILFRIEDYSKVWIEAEAYPEEVKLAKVGKSAKIKIEGFSSVHPGKIDFISPVIDQERRIVQVRVVVDNPALLIKPGMLASVHLNESGKERLSVRSEAVLAEQDHKMVWVKKADEEAFYPKVVMTGISGAGSTEILKGLEPGEVYVWSGAYLLNSEYKLRHSGEMGGHAH